MINTMKTNCLEFNIESIKKGIEAYQLQNGTDPNFIIMNDETKSALSDDKEYDALKNQRIKERYSLYYSVFWDIPIAICNKLNFGEVYFA